MPHLQAFIIHHEVIIRRSALFAVLYLCAIVLVIRPVIDPDLWLHLRMGELIFEKSTIPAVDSFSLAGYGKPLLAQNWSFELLIYMLHHAFGLVGIIFYAMTFAILITAALQRMVHRFELGFSSEIALCGAAIFALGRVLAPRSWLFSILFFILELDIIMSVRRTGDRWRMLWLLPLFALWANVHLQFCYGLFVLGLASLEPLLDREARRQGPSFVFLAIMVFSCVGATLITPFGWHLYEALFQAVGQTGPGEFITEMQAMPFRLPADWCVLAFTLGAVLAMGWRRHLRPFPWMLLATGVILSFRSQRDIWVVVCVTTALIAAMAPPACADERFCLTSARCAAVTLIVLAFVPIVIWFKKANNAHLQEVVAEWYPVRAVEVIRARGYKGPMFNDFNWGSYLIWTLRDPLVSMDGRTGFQGDARLRRSIATWSGGEDWVRDPELAAARLVVANHKQALASLLRCDPRFELAYEDKIAAVFIARRTDGVLHTMQGRP